MQDHEPGDPKMYETWSLGDHLNNIGFVLEMIAERGEISGLQLSDALSQIDIAKTKAETGSRWLRLENQQLKQRLMDAADDYKRRAARALSLGILIGAVPGLLLGFLFGVTGSFSRIIGVQL